MACPGGRGRFGVGGARGSSRGSASHRADNSRLPIHLGHSADYGEIGRRSQVRPVAGRKQKRGVEDVMMFRRVIIVVTLTAAISWSAGAEDFWGRRLPDQPTQFIFGYGSLINTASRNSTAAKPAPAIPVRISAAFGYIRAWNERSPSGFTALGLRHPDKGEAAM